MTWNDRQQTISREVSCRGVGLHTGAEVVLTLKPAPADSGVRFVRTDLREAPPLTVADVDPSPAPGRTALRNGKADVQTIEHLMAALLGCGVDNIEAHLDGPEVPGMDGSARAFSELLESAGLHELDAPAFEWVVESAVSVHDGDASLVALPFEHGYRLTYTLGYPQSKLAQGHATFDAATFRRDLAPCRTFCLKAEIEALLAQGLGKGATRDNTLVIDGDSVEGNTLRFSDEPLRHKVLDLIGDLALLGAPVRGHIIGMCSGHRLNRQLAAKLADVARRVKRPKREPSQLAAETLDVLRRIPHRAPFLFIDRIVRLEPNKRIVAIKYVNPDEFYFQGHFPARPIMPGVLVAEALLQAAGALLCTSSNNPPSLVKIDSFRLRQPVLPGDELELDVEVLNLKGHWARVRGVARVRGHVVGEGRFICAEMDLDKKIAQRSSGAAD